MKCLSFIIMTLICISGALRVNAQAVPSERKTKNAAFRNENIRMEDMRLDFKKPDMIYAPYAFWFYDAPLDPELAATMARKMASKGFNPGYPHARSSAAEPYCKDLAPEIPDKIPSLLPHSQWLSSLWFKTLDEALLETEKAGAHMGFVDDYWWPMGRADGKVLKKYPELETVSLAWDEFNIEDGKTIDLPESFFAVAAQLSNVPAKGDQARLIGKSLKVIGSGQRFAWTCPQGKWRVYAFKKIHQPGLDRGDVNYLDHRLAPTYLDIAYKPYEEYFGKRLGQGMSGVFCDHEGAYGFKLAWSDDMEALFSKKTSLDLRSSLPLLFMEDEEGQFVKIRWNWYDAVSDLYANGFFRPLARWCEERGMYFTGHTWETLAMQAAADGDYFKTQRAFTLPGQDCLGLGGLNPRDFKETQSIAEFEGKRFMSEVMGVTNWQQTPIQMKQVANAITAWGVNHVIPHGVYLNRELTSTPFPLDWFDENPFWEYFDLWTDFVRRASFINSSGDLAPDVLLVNPMDSVWISTCQATFDPKKTNFNVPVLFFDLPNWVTDEVNAIEKVYSGAIDILTKSRIEFMIADRFYINRMVLSKRGVLSEKNFAFKAVVLPRLTVLPLDVFRKLLIFAKSGGPIFYLDRLPQGSTENGFNDPEMNRMVEELGRLPNVKHCALEDLPRAIAEKIPPQVVFESGQFSLLQSHRRIDGRDFYWLANNDDTPKKCRLRIRDARGNGFIWNCENGEICSVACQSLPEGGSRVDLSFAPYEAFWLVFDSDAKTINEMPRPTPPASSSVVVKRLDGPWRTRIDRTRPTPLTPEILPLYSVEWDKASWLDTSRERFVRCVVSLPDYPTNGDITITADDEFRLWINGEPIKNRFGDDLWSQVSVYKIAQYLHPGLNVIAVDARKSRGLIFKGTVRSAKNWEKNFFSDASCLASDSGEESWQLAKFHAGQWKAVRVLGPPPLLPWIDVPASWLVPNGVETPLALWSQLGLPSFSGFMDYEKTFTIDVPAGDEVLDLGQVKHVAEVWVNGLRVGRRLWPPFRFEIGRALKKGKNTVHVRVGNTVGNVMNEFDKKGKLRVITGVTHATEAELESGLLGPVKIERNQIDK